MGVQATVSLDIARTPKYWLQLGKLQKTTYHYNILFFALVGCSTKVDNLMHGFSTLQLNLAITLLIAGTKLLLKLTVAERWRSLTPVQGI